MKKRTIQVADAHDFRYEVEVQHYPKLGFSMAYYKGQPIADHSYAMMSEPMVDNDAEWEQYEESLCEWMDQAESDLAFACQEYFNSKL